MPDLPPAQTQNPPQPPDDRVPYLSPESVSTTQEPPAPMLDVHPAHHAASTWRDFFIHIATICLGLLIAIWLDQTVEWVHHRHQRNELIANNREECRENIDVSADLLSYSAQEKRVALDWARLLEDAPVQNGWVTVTVPVDFRQREAQALASLHPGLITPEMTVLATARESQTLQYLPPEIAQYFEMHQKVDEWFEFYIRSALEAKAEYDGIMPDIPTGMASLPVKNTLRLSAASRDRAVQTLRTWIARTGYASMQLAGLNAYFHATSDGALTVADIRRWVQQHPKAH